MEKESVIFAIARDVGYCFSWKRRTRFQPSLSPRSASCQGRTPWSLICRRTWQRIHASHTRRAPECMSRVNDRHLSVCSGYVRGL
jgi:hypothetical protein